MRPVGYARKSTVKSKFITPNSTRHVGKEIVRLLADKPLDFLLKYTHTRVDLEQIQSSMSTDIFPFRI